MKFYGRESELALLDRLDDQASVHQLLAETGRFNQIGSYWEKNNHNELDVVAINDMEKRIVIAEIKLNKAKISMNVLASRATPLLERYPLYTPTLLALGFEDIPVIEAILTG
jgi:hypothetical protein